MVKQIRARLKKGSRTKQRVREAEQHRERTEELAVKAKEFARQLSNVAVKEATADLLRRIESLEAEIRAMKNGTGHYPKISL